MNEVDGKSPWWMNYTSRSALDFDRLQELARNAARFYQVRPLVYGFKTIEGTWEYTIGSELSRSFAWRPGVRE